MLPFMSFLTGLKAAEPSTSIRNGLVQRRDAKQPAILTEQCGQALGSLEELSGGDGVVLSSVDGNVDEALVDGVEKGGHDGVYGGLIRTGVQQSSKAGSVERGYGAKEAPAAERWSRQGGEGLRTWGAFRYEALKAGQIRV
jgi:hypothetical protein